MRSERERYAIEDILEKLKAPHPDVPWQMIADSGNVYRHGYDISWQIES